MSQTNSVRLVVDASKVIGVCDQTLWANIGYDPIYRNTVPPEFKPAWDLIKKSNSIRYIRCHNMFSDGFPNQRDRDVYGCRIYSEDSLGIPRYNWQYLDLVLDTWTQAGCKPVLEADFMPDALAAGTIVRNYSGGAINPPNDYNKWKELMYQTVKHCEERYGRDEVRTWYWEVWNEPDLSQYFGGTVNDLIKMYDYFVAGATAADSLIKVGGPGLAGNETFFRTFINHCVNGTNFVTGKKGTRIDFISWHTYGTLTSIMAKNRKMRSIVLNDYPSLAHCELQQNEWGQVLNPNPVSVMTSFEAGFLVKFIDALYSDSTIRVDKFLRWGSPTVLVQSRLGEGWRVLSDIVKGEVIPLSIFNAYDMLVKLGGERILLSGTTVRDTIHGIATREMKGRDSLSSVQILVYNFQEQNTDAIGDSSIVKLEIQGLKNWKEAKLNHYRIDKNHSDVFNEWKAMGSPTNPTPEQFQQLKSKSVLEMIDSPQRLLIQNEQLNLSIILPVNAVSLLLFSDAITTDVKELENMSKGFELYQNYPNPFSERTNIRFQISVEDSLRRDYRSQSTEIRNQKSEIVLKVYDLFGREVATLINSELEPGEYEVQFDSHTSQSNHSNGLFFYRLITPTSTQTKTMLLMERVR